MISLCDGERVASPTDTERASELSDSQPRMLSLLHRIQRDYSARLNVENLSETGSWVTAEYSWQPETRPTLHPHISYCELSKTLQFYLFFSANDYIIRGTEIYSGYRYSEIFWDILRYFIDIPVATAIASRGVLGTSMTLPTRNIKNPGPGMPASIVLYLLPCKCRTEL